VRVLYVSHTPVVGGGERSLLALLEALPTGIEPVLAAPEGELADAARALNVPVVLIDEVAASRVLTPSRASLAVAGFARSAVAIRRLVRQWRIDAVHANSIRAGLLVSATGVPKLVHVRDVLPPSASARAACALVRVRATVVLANSTYTASRFGAPLSGKLLVVSPWVDAIEEFNPRRIDRLAARRALGLEQSDATLGVVGQLSPWKGQRDALDAFVEVRRRLPAATLVLAGSVLFPSGASFDNVGYEQALKDRVRTLGLDSAVRFLGERKDVAMVMRALDLLLVPSWEEPFGRAVIEGMAMELPVVATNVGGPAELIDDGVTGVLLPPRSPKLWADAALELLADSRRATAMGVYAREYVLREHSRRRGVDNTLAAYALLHLPSGQSTYTRSLKRGDDV
jgi:glycosyltransferase involved in cell wall biosynthesis